MLRLALANLEKQDKTGSLHLARVVARCASLVPLGEPLLCGLRRRPYFACREEMCMS